MLAKRRSIRLAGVEIARTPLLVPSFSSKGFPQLAGLVNYCSELIDGVALFSAYDLHYQKIKGPFTFPSLIFLDSGGYEASRDVELSDFGVIDHDPKKWTPDLHEAQLSIWTSDVPTVFISFDSPKERLSISDQIERARRVAGGKGGLIREILLKPDTKDRKYLNIDTIISHVHSLAEFQVIGVTEKEVGGTIHDRMANIAKLRTALTSAGLETPIHVFGSLDTMTTPLYFLAGADIFDGLTWLRFAYQDGLTIYKQNYAAMAFGINVKANLIDERVVNSNYFYLKKLESEMRRFLAAYDFDVFAHHAELFRTSYQTIAESIGA